LACLYVFFKLHIFTWSLENLPLYTYILGLNDVHPINSELSVKIILKNSVAQTEHFILHIYRYRRYSCTESYEIVII